MALRNYAPRFCPIIICYIGIKDWFGKENPIRKIFGLVKYKETGKGR